MRVYLYGFMACVACATQSPTKDGTTPTTTSSSDLPDNDPTTDSPVDSNPLVDTSDSGDAPVDPFLDCRDQFVLPLTWPDLEERDLPGTFELGQTHVAAFDDSRHTPTLVEGREAILLFTPTTPLPNEATVFVGRAEGGTIVEVVSARAPSSPVPLLEQQLTSTTLEPYASDAWSAVIPWSWMNNGTTLVVGHVTSDAIETARLPLSGMGPHHTLTITRSKLVLFGDETTDIDTLPAAKGLQDFYASVPTAIMHWVDTTPLVLDSLVVPTSSGPRVVTSEEERLRVTSESNRWSILKNQFALRMSLANTGRGLTHTTPSEGDSSPYSYGTSLVMGFVCDDSGCRDANDAGLAAGWTGWTALWTEECGNGFIHELGHSFTLAHFTTGTAASWGIDDEYPADGTNLSSHPWGYDTTRRALRTWYRVDSSGPVSVDGEWVGKRDPMNGGESPNAITCYPQYTAYHAEKAQAWMQNTPTLTNVGGVPGVWQWNASAAQYESSPPEGLQQAPTAIGVPVVTLIGTLGNADEANQTYPPLFSSSGNVFVLPDPTDGSLTDEYSGTQWFLRIRFADGTTQDAFIAEGPVTDTSLRLFAVNVALADAPVGADLYFANAPWPDLNRSEATKVHTLDFTVPDDLPAVQVAGEDRLGNVSLDVSDWCTPDVDCTGHVATSTWREDRGQRSFSDLPPISCGTPDDVTAFTVAATHSDGSTATVTLHGQRVLSDGDTTLAVPLNDHTPWIDRPDLEQSVRVWIPYDENASIAAGQYTASYPLSLYFDDVLEGSIQVNIQLEVLEQTAADVSAGYLHPDGVTLADSSVYYLVRDPSMGPTTRVWWDDGVPGGTILSTTVVDTATGAVTTLYLEAWKRACGTDWDLNTGQSAGWGCTHQAYLEPAEGRNTHLESGHSYQSPGSRPLVLEARRWHDPGGQTLLATYALQLAYRHP